VAAGIGQGQSRATSIYAAARKRNSDVAVRNGCGITGRERSLMNFELDRVPNEIFATPGRVLRPLGLGRTYEQAQDNLFHLCFSFSFSNFN